MVNIRNKGTEDLYLDAALECILAVGVRRTTITDIARRAGVARMTLYRRWPDMSTLLGDLMTREWIHTADAIAVPRAGTPDPSGIATAVVTMIASVRESALFRKILDVDPEFLLPYLLNRRGRAPDAMLETIEKVIVEGQRGGTVRPGDPAVIARALFLSIYGLAISAQTMSDGAKPDQLDSEMQFMIERFLTS